MFAVDFVQLTRLQDENHSLVGKHSKHSQELQDKAIDLPNTTEVSSFCFLTFDYCICRCH